MVWTSDYPEGRPVSAKPEGPSASGNGKGKAGAQATASKPDSQSSSSSTFQYVFGSSKPKSGSTSIPDYAKPAVNPISGFKPKKPPGKPPNKPGIFLLLLGVILPVAALGVELTTHMCAKSFFDPLPTAAHVLLFALIPLSSARVLQKFPRPVFRPACPGCADENRQGARIRPLRIANI